MPTKTKSRSRAKTADRLQRRVFAEIADFLASSPTREQILDYHPSPRLQRRASELLRKLREDELTDQDRNELDEFGHAEALIRMLKTKLRGTQRQ
jgi:hypothetical protein